MNHELARQKAQKRGEPALPSRNSKYWRLPVKPFTRIAVLVFALVAFFQLLRIALGWAVAINGIAIPPWASAVVAVVAATLAFKLWREVRA